MRVKAIAIVATDKPKIKSRRAELLEAIKPICSKLKIPLSDSVYDDLRKSGFRRFKALFQSSKDVDIDKLQSELEKMPILKECDGTVKVERTFHYTPLMKGWFAINIRYTK